MSFCLLRNWIFSPYISCEGVKADPKKIDSVLNWPTPKTLKALRGFLELIGYFKKFVKNYGIIATPLTSFLKKDAFLWNEYAATTF